MGKSSPPPAPDYVGAAQATAAGNKEAAIASQIGNMVNQVTPQGTVTYSKIGEEQGVPRWQQTVALSPEQQAAYEKDVAMNAALQNVGTQGVGYVQQALGQPLSFGGMQAIQTPGQIQQQAADAAYNLATGYMGKRHQQEQAALETQLANQGITRGSEAWNNAMSQAQQGRAQEYSQAQNQAYLAGLQGAGQAYQQGMGARQQQIAEAQTLRQDPINMLNAVRTGAQMQTAAQPQVGVSSPGQLATWAGPDLLGAASAQGQYDQSVYNAKVAQQNALMSGLFSLGSAGIMRSDPRTKENVIKIGRMDNGLDIYAFDYKPEFKAEAGHGRYIGHMADEVEALFPAAVSTDANGYKMVNYGVIYG